MKLRRELVKDAREALRVSDAYSTRADVFLQYAETVSMLALLTDEQLLRLNLLGNGFEERESV